MVIDLVCAHCDAPFTYEWRTGQRRKYCSERCKANAGAALKAARKPERRCACGSTEVGPTNKPVCPDCRKDGRDRQGYNRTRRLALYGLTAERFDELLALQRGRCAVCTTTEPGSRGWFIDHDHACCPGIGSCGDCVRGLVCHDCNIMLGNAKDDIAILERAIKYLQVNSVDRGSHHLKVVADGD